jgi:PTS system nitrogen regulatory IIA component
MTHVRFTLHEVADYLHLPVADVELLVKRREIPFTLVGSRPVFVRVEIDAWASQRLLGFTRGPLADYHRKTSARMHNLDRTSAIVSELLQPNYVACGLASRTKASIIRDMVGIAESAGVISDRAELIESITARERMCSTALAGGMAILHPEHHLPYMSDDSFILLARTVQPIPFGSPDGQTTDVFFLVCCQDDRIHLHVLARICMLCYHTPLLTALRESESAAAMHALVVQHEIDLVRSLG